MAGAMAPRQTKGRQTTMGIGGSATNKSGRSAGRQRTVTPWQQRNAAGRVAHGETSVAVAKDMNVCSKTVWNWVEQISEVDAALSAKRPRAFDWRMRTEEQ